MDDKTFDDQDTARDWIDSIESDYAKVRKTDLYPKLRDWVNKTAPIDILDLGCGQGVCSGEIDLRGRNYIGVEPSPLLRKRAEELYGEQNRKFIFGDIYNLPLADASIDAVFSIAVWHLLSNLPKAASELCRVLRTRGHFLIITANPSAYNLWTNRYTDRQVIGRQFRGKISNERLTESYDILYLHTLEEILESLQSSNLIVSSTEEFRIHEDGSKQFLLIEGHRF